MLSPFISLMQRPRVCFFTVLLLATNHYCFAKSAQQYELDIHVNFHQSTLGDSQSCIPVQVQVKQDKSLLKRLSWKNRSNMQQLEADGQLEFQADRWTWVIPDNGGELRYCVQLNAKRDRNHYDGRVTPDWALFRADDLFPAVRSVSYPGSYSRTYLDFNLPTDWSSVIAYPPAGTHRYHIDNPQRRLDRPTGWVQLGRLGIRRDQVASTRITVAAPVGQGIQRMEIMTLLTFSLPTLREWFPQFPDRLLIISAIDEMWRGALSAPNSIYLHGERPLVSENGTSTLMHELVHVGMQRHAAKDADWIDEGLAEYLGLLLLKEAGGLTDKRFQASLDRQQRWAKQANRLARRNSRGAATAKAVGVFAALHAEIGDQHFHRLISTLATDGPIITTELLRELAEVEYGHPVDSLP